MQAAASESHLAGPDCAGAIILSVCITMLQVQCRCAVDAAPTVISNFFHIAVKRLSIWNYSHVPDSRMALAFRALKTYERSDP